MEEQETVELGLPAAEAGGGFSLIAMLVITLITVPLALIFLLADLSGGDTDAMYAFRIFGAALLLLWAALGATYANAVRHPPKVTLDGHNLTIRHRALLCEPFSIPLERLECIVVDSGEAGERRRFSVPANSSERALPVDWVWQPGANAIPLLALKQTAPNVLVLLKDEISSPRVRREQTYGPLNGERIKALVIRVKDPEAAKAAFRPWSRKLIPPSMAEVLSVDQPATTRW